MIIDVTCVHCDEGLGICCRHKYMTFDLLSQAKAEYQKVMMQLMEERQQHQVVITKHKQVHYHDNFAEPCLLGQCVRELGKIADDVLLLS